MDIQKVQERLKELGIFTAEVDGLNGPKTKAAIKAFQRINDLEPDGEVGPLTEAALFPDEDIEERNDIPEQEVAKEEHPFKKATRIVWPRQSEVRSFYGEVGTRQVSVIVPYRMVLAWDKKKVVKQFSVHEKCHDSVSRALQRIAETYDEDARRDLGIDLFGGSLNVRKMRGGNAWSMHSWGIAIDFDPERNQLKWGSDRARLARPDAEAFWKIWEDEGGVSLGRARNYDWMHVQFARL